jgi:uncharacterized protein YegL
MAVSLDKKIESLEGQTSDKHFVSLAKQARVSLKKSGMNEHVARVVLVLDISGSMDHLFRNGTVAAIVKKALAVGYLLDDNGEIDIILFGDKAHQFGSVSINSLDQTVNSLVRTRLEGYTRYEEAINAVRDLVMETPDQAYPTLVQFITDGEPTSRDRAEKAIRVASKAGVFFQFVGVGSGDYDPREGMPVAQQKTGFFSRLFADNQSSGRIDGACQFEFLRKLDDLPDRHTDNAGFFAVKDPKSISDEKYYDLLLSEYPNWVNGEFPKTNLRNW